MSSDVASPQKSTSVRSPLGLRVGSAALRTAAALSPALAAWAADRLFCTPPRHPPPRREREALRGAERLTLPFGSGWLRAWRLGDGPPVLLVHGWGGRGSQLAAFVPPLLSAGLGAVLLDAPAHGGSPGRLSSVVDFGRAVGAAARAVGARAVIAHSVGAAGTGLALRDGLRLDAAVLLGPPRSPAGFFRQFTGLLRLDPAVVAATRARMARRIGIAIEELDAVRSPPGVATPVLVIHDRGDAEVPWAHGAAIAASWPGARLLTTEGLGHRRILRDADVAAEAVAFVAERLRACPCGAAAVTVGDEPRCERCELERQLFEPSRRWAA